jgi:hypothetical protein
MYVPILRINGPESDKSRRIAEELGRYKIAFKSNNVRSGEIREGRMVHDRTLTAVPPEQGMFDVFWRGPDIQGRG